MSITCIQPYSIGRYAMILQFHSHGQKDHSSIVFVEVDSHRLLSTPWHHSKIKFSVQLTDMYADRAQ